MMNLNLEDFLKYSYVISIDDRRYHNFSTIFKNSGFNIIPKRYDGFTINQPAYKNEYTFDSINAPIVNVSLTHASIIKMAKVQNYPFVVIFEDDAYPCADVLGKLEYYLKGIPDEANILKVGSIASYRRNGYQTQDGKYWTNIITYGSHSYIVFKKYYDIYMRIFNKSIICDHEVFNSYSNIYMTDECLFIQRNSDANGIGKVMRGQDNLNKFGKLFI